MTDGRDSLFAAPLLRAQLLEMMSGWSEDNWRSGWMSGLEEMLYEVGGAWEVLGRLIGWPLGCDPADEQWVSWDEAGRVFADRKQHRG